MKSFILCAFFVSSLALNYLGPLPKTGKHKIICDKVLNIQWYDVNTDVNTNYNVTLQPLKNIGSNDYEIKLLANNPTSDTKSQNAIFPCSLPAGFYQINIEKLDDTNKSLGITSSSIFGFLKNEAGGCFKQSGCDDSTGDCDSQHRQISYLCCPVDKTCVVDDVLCKSLGLNIPNVNLKNIKIKTMCSVNLYGIGKNFNENTQINSTSQMVLNVTSDITFDANNISSGIYPLLTSSAKDISLKTPKVINESPLYNLTFKESTDLEYDKTIFYLEVNYLFSDNKTVIIIVICACIVGLIVLGCLYYQCCYKKGKCKGKESEYEKEKEVKV